MDEKKEDLGKVIYERPQLTILEEFEMLFKFSPIHSKGFNLEQIKKLKEDKKKSEEVKHGENLGGGSEQNSKVQKEDSEQNAKS